MSPDSGLVDLRSAGPPFAVGVIAVVGTLPSLTPAAAPPVVPRWVIVAAILAAGVLLVGAAALAGAALARDVDLQTVSPERLRDGGGRLYRAPLFVGSAVALMTLLAHVTAATTAGIDPFATIVDAGTVDAVDVVSRVASGVVVELVFRFGLMTAVVWATWVYRPGLDARATPVSVWTGIAVAAVASALSSVPLSLLGGDLLVVSVDLVRTVVGGVAFGWLYWRYDLVAALLAHAVANLLWALVVAAV